MKITIVGGAAASTPGLVTALAGRPGLLDVSEIVLVDPDQQRLEQMGALCQHLLHENAPDTVCCPPTVRVCPDLEPGATGAAAVLLQPQVADEAPHPEGPLPLGCACPEPAVVGAAALSRALRVVPVAVDVAERVRAVAPDAWLVNTTSPVGVVTGALLRDDHRVVGLCSEAFTARRWLAGLLGVPPEVVFPEYVGLHHLWWVRGVLIKGPNAIADVLPPLLQGQAAELAGTVGLPEALLHRLGMVPGPHLAPFYLAEQVERAHRLGPVPGTTPAARPGPAGPSMLGLAAAELLEALLTGGGAMHVVHVRNGHTVPALPADTVVELPCTVDTAGPVPAAVRPLEPALAGLASHVAAFGEATLDAALHGGRDRVADALLAHPLLRDFATIEQLADEIVASNATHLPWAGK